jgi:hypothetical protein
VTQQNQPTHQLHIPNEKYVFWECARLNDLLVDPQFSLRSEAWFFFFYGKRHLLDKRARMSLPIAPGSGASIRGVLPSLSTASGLAPLKIIVLNQT